MKKLSALIIVLAFAFIGIFSTNAKSDESYVIQLKSGADVQKVMTKHGLQAKYIYGKAVNGFASKVPYGQLKKLESDTDVLSVSLDRQVKAHVKPDKPGKPPKEDPTPVSNQIIPSGVERIGAASVDLSYSGNGVGVAIVDTGIDFAHIDLNVSLDCFYAPHSTSCQDDEGHGTHVGGIVAALDNDSDVVGVAPSATLYAVKVLDSAGSGYDSDIIAGLDWIATNAATLNPPINVVNMSLGREGTVDDNPAMHTAIQNLYNTGISVITSAGNDPYTEVSQNIPAGYPEVMAIASTTAVQGKAPKNGLCKGAYISRDTASYFTTDGAEVTVSAPGAHKEDVKVNCNLVLDGILSLLLGGGTTRMSGTSMSSPHVAGVVALMYEKDGLLTPELVRSALKAGADMVDVAPFDSPTSVYTYDGVREGVLNAPGALAVLDL